MINIYFYKIEILFFKLALLITKILKNLKYFVLCIAIFFRKKDNIYMIDSNYL